MNSEAMILQEAVLPMYKFPYELSRYLLCLIMTVLLSVTLGLLLNQLGGSTTAPERVWDNIVTGILVMTPVLILSSLTKRLWAFISAILVVYWAWSIFVIVALMPGDVGSTALKRVWVSKSVLCNPLVVYVIPILIFQRFCNWCRITEATCVGGGEDE